MLRRCPPLAVIAIGLLTATLAPGWPALAARSTTAPLQLFEVEAVELDRNVDGSAARPSRLLLADTVLSAPGPGTYLVVDTRGIVGEARVLPGRMRGWNKSAATPPLHVELEWIAPPRRAPRAPHLVAVGPIATPLPQARLMRVGLARAGAPADEPDEEARGRGPQGAATLAVDLDGDGEADLVAYRNRRSLPRNRPHLLDWEGTGETWRRTGTGWLKVESSRWIGQTLVGP